MGRRPGPEKLARDAARYRTVWLRRGEVRGRDYRAGFMAFRYWWTDSGDLGVVYIARGPYRWTTPEAVVRDEIWRVHGRFVKILTRDGPWVPPRPHEIPFDPEEVVGHVLAYIEQEPRLPSPRDPDDGALAFRYRLQGSPRAREIRVAAGRGAGGLKPGARSVAELRELLERQVGAVSVRIVVVEGRLSAERWG